jgi:hypothetical protein
MDARDRRRRLAERPRPGAQARRLPHIVTGGARQIPARSGNRASPVSRKGRWLFRAPTPWPDATEALIALARAWTVTTIATALLSAALAVAPMWDNAIFMQGLRDALSSDPELPQMFDAGAGASVGCGFSLPSTMKCQAGGRDVQHE